MKKRLLLIGIAAIVFVAIVVMYIVLGVDALLGETKLFALITAVTAIVGVFGLIYQQSRLREVNSAQFLTTLSQMYINHNEYQELLDELEQTRKTRKGANITEEQKRIAANCLDFFEPVYVLIKSNAITMAQIDDLFCYRFFALVNNPIVQDCVIRPYHLYYSNIAKLHKEWTRFIIRSSKNKKVPYFETDLSKKPWYKEML